MYTVYVIKSVEGFRYTGCTSDMQKRLDQHNSGISIWTRRGTNWNIIYQEQYENKTKAFKREKWLKSGHGRDYLDKLLDGS